MSFESRECSRIVLALEDIAKSQRIMVQLQLKAFGLYADLIHPPVPDTPPDDWFTDGADGSGGA